MRVIVCGGRKYDDEVTVRMALMDLPDDTVVVHGGAPGADSLVEFVWRTGWIRRTEVHRAAWDDYGAGAGPRRNQEMLDAGADLVIAFPGGKGTADMVTRARKAGVEVREVHA